MKNLHRTFVNMTGICPRLNVVACMVTMLATISVSSQATLLLSESFNDAPGTTPPTGWTNNSSVGDGVEAGSLTAPSGLAASSGNSFTLSGNDNDIYTRTFTPTDTSTTVYYSMLLRINSISNLGLTSADSPIFILGNSGSAKVAAGLSVAKDADNSSAYNIGISGSNHGIGFAGTLVDTTEYAVGDTQLLVVAYTPKGGWSEMSLWINPDSSSFGAASAPIATLSPAIGYAPTAISSITFQSRWHETATGSTVDEIRVGTTWADVTPVPEPASVVLMGLGLMLMIGCRCRFRG